MLKDREVIVVSGHGFLSFVSDNKAYLDIVIALICCLRRSYFQIMQQ